MDYRHKIGALIPTFNRAQSLAQCLDCLRVQDFTHSPVFLQPIVIVDGSTDGTLEMLKTKFPEVVVILGDGNWWYTKCINEGIKEAIKQDCNFVLTLNDDIIFAPDYIGTLLRDYESCPPGSVIGSVSLSKDLPRRITFSGVSKISFTLKEYNYIPKFSVVEEVGLSGVRPSVILSGRGILYPVSIFSQLGLYDERLIQYSSETDFTFSAFKKKIPVWISYNAVVYENVHLTSAGAVYNNPTLGALIKSFRDVHSINSFGKIWYYSIKHKGAVLGRFIAFGRTLGTCKKFAIQKWKTKK
jgi:GT2 family glycosyltransferase